MSGRRIMTAGRDPPGGDPHLPRDRREAGRHGRAGCSSASSAGACRWPGGSPPRSPRTRASTVPVGALDITFYRDDLLARRPAAARQGHRPAVRHRRRDGRARRRRPVHRPHDPGGDGRPASSSGGRGRSGSPSSSTAATASCRSAPTTSARTSRRRARRSSGCARARSTARTRVDIEQARRSRRRRAGRVTVIDRRPAVAGDAVEVRSSMSPPEAQPVGWRHRHLLDIDVLTWPADRARHATPPTRCARSSAGRSPRSRRCAAGRHDPVLRGLDPDPRLLRGRREAPVGRRRNIAASGSSVTKGESLRRHGADARGARRADARHAPRDVRRAVPRRAGVRRARCSTRGDGWHAHPTQALLDLYTLRRAPAAAARCAAGRS